MITGTADVHRYAANSLGYVIKVVRVEIVIGNATDQRRGGLTRAEVLSHQLWSHRAVAAVNDAHANFAIGRVGDVVSMARRVLHSTGVGAPVHVETRVTVPDRLRG